MLYLRAGESRPAADTFGTPGGHAVRLDEDGNVIGVTIVNAKWLLERDGKIGIAVPEVIETSVDESVGASSASSPGGRSGAARGQRAHRA